MPEDVAESNLHQGPLDEITVIVLPDNEVGHEGVTYYGGDEITMLSPLALEMYKLGHVTFR